MATCFLIKVVALMVVKIITKFISILSVFLQLLEKYIEILYITTVNILIDVVLNIIQEQQISIPFLRLPVFIQSLLQLICKIYHTLEVINIILCHLTSRLSSNRIIPIIVHIYWLLLFNFLLICYSLITFFILIIDILNLTHSFNNNQYNIIIFQNNTSFIYAIKKELSYATIASAILRGRLFFHKLKVTHVIFFSLLYSKKKWLV